MKNHFIWKFKKKYAEIAEGKRDKIAAIIDDKKLSWNDIYLEICNKTEKGVKALDFLAKLEVI